MKRFQALGLTAVLAGCCAVALLQADDRGTTVAPARPGSHKWALLIGVDDYTVVRKLKYCGRDMTALRERLQAAGFPDDHVILLHDGARERSHLPFKANIERQLQLVLGQIDDKGQLVAEGLAGKGDLVVVAFSGHGVHLGETSYLCPAETDLDRRETLLSLERVYRHLHACPADRKLLLVDACRNIPTAGGARDVTRDAVQDFAKSLGRPPRGILLLTSCSVGQQSWENEELKHGVFMHYLLEGLDGAADLDKDGRVSMLELYRYASRQTRLFVARPPRNQHQTPTLKGEIEEDFEIGAARAAIDRAAKEVVVDLGGGVKMEFGRIPRGKFLMGSPEGEKDRSKDEERHEVEITRDFFLGKYEVTQEQYQKVMGENPSAFSAGGGGKERVSGLDTRRFPVENVSWEDAVRFCGKLGEKAGGGRNFRLPSEAEWEYACRAGTTTPFHFGGALNGDKANCDGKYPYGTDEKGRYLQRTCRVGSYAANAFGLHDMHGNVFEWCQDWYGPYAGLDLKDPLRTEKVDYTYRVLRGGSWGLDSRVCRAAYRGGHAPSIRSVKFGFRVAFRLD